MQAQQQGQEAKNSANMFVLNMILVYAVWKAFAYYVKHTSGAVHRGWADIIYFLGTVYASVTSTVLNVFGENTTHSGIGVFFPTFNKEVTVEDHCLGIPATIIFVGTIMLFKGNRRDKFWFIPLGISLIILINLTRLVLLCYTFAHFPRPFFDINHSLVYVIVTYSLVFLLIVLWMRKFALKNAQ